MLNHSVEREIAAGLWIHKSLCAEHQSEVCAEAFVLADWNEDERVSCSAALLQCYLLLQFLRFVWE